MADGEALRELYVRFSAEVEGADELDKLDEHADHASHSVEHAAESAHEAHGTFKLLGEALEGVVAVIAGSEILHGIRETTEGLEQLAHLSEQTGIASADIEFFGFVVEQAGGSAQEFQGQLSALQRSLSKTDKATSPQAAALKKLGIETDDAAGQTRGMGEILPEVFENFEKIKDPAEEAAVATRLFGKSGLALLPVLREGRKGFEEYREQFEATGGATPEEAIKRAQEYEKSLKRMTAAFNDLKTHLVAGVLPSLTHVVEFLTKGTAKLSGFLKGTTAADHAIVALAAAFAGPLLGALKPFLGPGLKFLAIYAAVDDVLAFLEGKRSVIGRTLDAMFGNGTADQVRAWVLDAKNAFTDFVASADATADALESSTATWTEKALATVVAFVRDAANGFPAFRAGFAETLDLMTADLQSAVASMLELWASFTQKISLPPAVKAAIALLPGGGAAVAAVSAAEASGTAASAGAASLRTSAAQNRSEALDRDAERRAALRGRNSNVFGTAAGGDAARQLLAEDDQIGKGPRTAKTAASPEAAALARQGEQFALLTAGRAAGITGTVTQDNKINITLPPGTGKDSELAKQVKQAVADALNDNNRAALQLITQRGEKK